VGYLPISSFGRGQQMYIVLPLGLTVLATTIGFLIYAIAQAAPLAHMLFPF